MSARRLDRLGVVPFLAEVFARRGAESYLGEPVSMAQHMLQGAWLAEREAAGEELIAAALLHDIGHFTGEFGAYTPADTEDRRHDRAGGAILAPYFPPEVAEPVRLHVAAKRYLCAVEPEYLKRLSRASTHSLGLQGGPMGAAEVAAFRAEPHHAAAVRVRRWDEAGKVAGMKTRAFADYAPMLQRLVDRHAGR